MSYNHVNSWTHPRRTQVVVISFNFTNNWGDSSRHVALLGQIQMHWTRQNNRIF